jgi:Ser/Thr protein kinase RdoA (MazF antagonist)
VDLAEAEAVFGAPAREALARFPIAPAEVRPVHVSENATFRVTDVGGAGYTLRLHRPGYHTLEELVSERAWTRALAEAGIATPEPVQAADRADYVSVEVPARGEHRYAGVARWVEGTLLWEMLEGAEFANLATHFARLGALVAAIHQQSDGWRPPPGFRRHALDEDGLMGEAPWWGPFWEYPVLSAAERSVLLATRDRIRAALIRLGRDPAIFSLIHADLHPGNVVVTEGGFHVIDFDDAGFGWHMYEVAVALYRYRDRPEAEHIRDAFVAGYRSVRPLPDDQVALLPMFTLVRRLASMGWEMERPELGRAPWSAETRRALVAECVAFEAPC